MTSGTPALRWRGRDAIAGSTIAHGAGRTIGRDEQILLAWATNNASGVHGNVDRSSRGRFGDVIVLGALTVAVVAGLAEPQAGPPETAAADLPTGWTGIYLLAPVAPGDTLRATSEVEAVARADDGRSVVITRSILGRNQRDEAVVRIEETRTVPW
jgi:acyl dehydratase